MRAVFFRSVRYFKQFSLVEIESAKDDVVGATGAAAIEVLPPLVSMHRLVIQFVSLFVCDGACHALL